jgi:hypothetical protein
MNNENMNEISNQEPREKKTGFEVQEEYCQALVELETLPDLLQVVIRRFNLDHEDLTGAERIELGNGYRELYSVLGTVQRQLWDMKDKIDNITL